MGISGKFQNFQKPIFPKKLTWEFYLNTKHKLALTLHFQFKARLFLVTNRGRFSIFISYLPHHLVLMLPSSSVVHYAEGMLFIIKPSHLPVETKETL
ncbi:hypothetical protein JZ751_021686 [Albula glossodonta]|uniref:Uncharacterized protein n=1 Tax=Albula glossodonta TaxID=121402 RepID=A0A8T2NIN8_9TELE|nr:hypothetical protein JZ751_021686 [Albula glossodonta]